MPGWTLHAISGEGTSDPQRGEGHVKVGRRWWGGAKAPGPGLPEPAGPREAGRALPWNLGGSAARLTPPFQESGL